MFLPLIFPCAARRASRPSRWNGRPVRRLARFAAAGADGISHIYPPEDPAQDESDALTALPQDILARLILPLGSFTPEDVQEMAADFNV